MSKSVLLVESQSKLATTASRLLRFKGLELYTAESIEKG